MLSVFDWASYIEWHASGRAIPHSEHMLVHKPEKECIFGKR